MISQGQAFVIRGVRSYIRRYCSKPAPIWPKREFINKAYIRWTADEMIDYLLNHGFHHPMYALEEFLKKMDQYSCVGKDVDNRYIFSIAYDAAQDIIDYVSYVYCGGMDRIERSKR